MTPALKERLDAAAEAGGRSQSQEAEFRLERSFEREALLTDVLALAFGERTAGITIMLAAVLETDGWAALSQSDTQATHWSDDPYASDRAIKGAIEVLEKLRPAGKVVEPSSDPDFRPRVYEQRWTALASIARRPKAGPQRHVQVNQHGYFPYDLKRVFEMLGPDLLERLRRKP